MRRLLAILIAAPIYAHASAIECAIVTGVEAEAERQINRLNIYPEADSDPVAVQLRYSMSSAVIVAVLAVHDYVRLDCPEDLEPSPQTITHLYVIVGKFAEQLTADGVPDVPRGTWN